MAIISLEGVFDNLHLNAQLLGCVLCSEKMQWFGSVNNGKQ